MSLYFFVVLFLALLGWIFLYSNIHTVVRTQVYRSAQLSPGYLQYLIKLKGIKSIINLRGQQPDDWYADEQQIAKLNNIHYYNIPLSSYSPASKPELEALVQLLSAAPKPVLIHCEGGADRSGLVSAIVLILDDKSYPIAAKQFSWEYLVVREKSTGKITLPAYYDWLERHQLISSHSSFLEWLHSSD
jgi:protein tyrosine phosphatase (PTP) superfamily phosphohydrolase (DUF442 family)